jgi:hypothetical protein
MATAWYAVSLLPRTVVAGQGVRTWVQWPLLLTAIMLLRAWLLVTPWLIVNTLLVIGLTAPIFSLYGLPSAGRRSQAKNQDVIVFSGAERCRDRRISIICCTSRYVAHAHHSYLLWKLLDRSAGGHYGRSPLPKVDIIDARWLLLWWGSNGTSAS